MSHLLIGLILVELFNIRKKSLVLLGALLPDLLAKIHLIFFHLDIPPFISFISFHTPAMVFLLSMLIAPLFKYDKIKTVLFFNVGSMSHFLADLSIKHFGIVGTRLLFPFSMKNYTLNWIWPDQSIYILAASLFVYVASRTVKKQIR